MSLFFKLSGQVILFPQQPGIIIFSSLTTPVPIFSSGLLVLDASTAFVLEANNTLAQEV